MRQGADVVGVMSHVGGDVTTGLSYRRGPMPVQTAKKTVRTACETIRKRWSNDEAQRRREAAEQMQQRLVEALGLRAAAPR